MNLPGGYTIGMSEDDLIAALEADGIAYEVEDSGSYRYYRAGEGQLEHGLLLCLHR